MNSQIDEIVREIIGRVKKPLHSWTEQSISGHSVVAEYQGGIVARFRAAGGSVQLGEIPIERMHEIDLSSYDDTVGSLEFYPGCRSVLCMIAKLPGVKEIGISSVWHEIYHERATGHTIGTQEIAVIDLHRKMYPDFKA